MVNTKKRCTNYETMLIVFSTISALFSISLLIVSYRGLKILSNELVESTLSIKEIIIFCFFMFLSFYVIINFLILLLKLILELIKVSEDKKMSHDSFVKGSEER